jgi:hypothetical protein
LAHPSVDGLVKDRLREIYRMLDPVALLAEVRNIQAELGQRVDQRPSKIRIAASQQTDHIGDMGQRWSRGEQRAIHRRPYVRRKPVPRRSSMLDPYKHLIDEWLAAAAHTPAVQILARLIKYAPNQFSQKQERTVDRFVKNWRAQAARHLIASTEAVIRVESGPTDEIAAHTAQIETAAKVQLGA